MNLRCEITGNPCGTDTWPVVDGAMIPCHCDTCAAYLGCPACESHDVVTHHVDEPFLYGAIALSAVIPLRRCVTCDFQYTDVLAERAQQEAIDRFKKV